MTTHSHIQHRFRKDRIMSSKSRRHERRRMQLEAEYRLLASSGKPELAPVASSFSSNSKKTFVGENSEIESKNRGDDVAEAGPNCASLDKPKAKKRNLDADGKVEIADSISELKKQRDAVLMPKFYVKYLKCDDSGVGVVELEEIYALVLYSIIGNKAPRKPHWCDLVSWRQVSQTILVIVDHDGSVDERDSKRFTFLQGNFLRRFNVNIPERKLTTQFYDGLFRVRLSILDQLREVLEEKDKESATIDCGVIIENKNEDGSRINPAAFSKLDLLLSPVDMASEDFPLPNYYSTNIKYSDYVYSRPTYSRPSADSPVYAIDCEMCVTASSRHELTRISIVDEQCRVVLDTLVKPKLPIIDYLTRFSGITPAMMADVSTTLEDVQRTIANLLEPNAILCGHSLNFDLHSLRIFHPYVIDTSVALNLSGQRRRKSALRVLASTFLDGMAIQESNDGHCSVEDAFATMQLLKNKLRQAQQFGSSFGNVVDGWNFSEFLKLRDDICQKRKSEMVDLESDDEPDQKRARRDGDSAEDGRGTMDNGQSRPEVDNGRESRDNSGLAHSGSSDQSVAADGKAAAGGLSNLDQPGRTAVCIGCQHPTPFNCRHDDCFCRSLDRSRCLQCIQERSGQDHDEIGAETMTKEFFPPLPGCSLDGSRCNQYKTNVTTLLKKNLKRLLLVQRSDRSIGSIIDGQKCRNVTHVVLPDGKRNEDVVAEFRSKLYEYDLNVLELSGQMDDEKKSLDRMIESVVKAAASKSLICVLFCNRQAEGGVVGRCYVKVKE